MTTENRVILTGRVHKPPQKYYRPDGSAVIEFPLELDDQENLRCQETRGLIDIVAIGQLAEAELDRLQRGQSLRVEGRLKQRRWQTPEGQYRSRTEVILTDLQWADRDEHNGEGRKG